jgi:hypothetical protein
MSDSTSQQDSRDGAAAPPRGSWSKVPWRTEGLPSEPEQAKKRGPWWRPY